MPKLLNGPELMEQTFRYSMGNITHHAPTETNTIGQSGSHTFVGDLMDIVLASDNESCARDAISLYLHCGDTNVHKCKSYPGVVKSLVKRMSPDTQFAFAIDVVKIFWSFNSEREIWKAIHQYMMGELTEV